MTRLLFAGTRTRRLLGVPLVGHRDAAIAATDRRTAGEPTLDIGN
ncbi:hypothetical protein ACN28C_28755 [Plantactinospora sp. WMMC1484]